MAYQTIPPSGGNQEAAARSWLATVTAFVQAKESTLTAGWFSICTDFTAFDRSAIVGTTGVAEIIKPTGSTNARIRLRSGTGASSYRIARNRPYAVPAGASVHQTLCANVRTSKWALASRVIINSVNNTCNFHCIDMSDEATQACYLGVIGASSQANFYMKIGSAAVQDTGVAIGTLGSTETDLIMIGDGTNVSSYIALNTTAAVAGLANTAANAAGHAVYFADNGATATNVGFDLLFTAAFTV